MDIAQDHKHHRKTQQRIQTKNKAHGDRGRGEILLYPPRLYCSKNGTALEVKPHWKGAQKPASLEDFGAVKIYTIYLTLPTPPTYFVVQGPSKPLLDYPAQRQQAWTEDRLSRSVSSSYGSLETPSASNPLLAAFLSSGYNCFTERSKAFNTVSRNISFAATRLHETRKLSWRAFTLQGIGQGSQS